MPRELPAFRSKVISRRSLLGAKAVRRSATAQSQSKLESAYNEPRTGLLWFDRRPGPLSRLDVLSGHCCGAQVKVWGFMIKATKIVAILSLDTKMKELVKAGLCWVRRMVRSDAGRCLTVSLRLSPTSVPDRWSEHAKERPPPTHTTPPMCAMGPVHLLSL